MWIFVGAESFMAACILAVGMTDDLRSKKVHNSLVLALFTIALAVAFAEGGLAAAGAIGLAVLASLLFIPLNFLGILGGGDVKLLIAASPLMGWHGLAFTFVFSLFWGALFGVLRSALKGELSSLITRTGLLVRSPGAKEFSIDRIPYTVAIFLGWLTYLSLQHYGGFNG